MANVFGTEFQETLLDMMECCICAENFTDPKILPCVHTFCLNCLEKFGKHKKPGDHMACPTCRNEFVIPPEGGLSKLPNNFFIGKLVEIRKLAVVTVKKVVCDVCFDESAVANMVCMDCEQKLCDRCSNSHTRIKHCKNHRVVEFASQLNFQKLNCEHHPKEFIEMYCHDDNVVVCSICCFENHQSHRCSNVDKAAGQFAEQLKDDLRIVSNRRPECEEALEKLEKSKTELAQEVRKAEENIRKAGLELKELIDLHTEILVQNLRLISERNLKCFEINMQNVDRLKVMIDSYHMYCEELLSRRSPVDICRAANQMHTRARTLEQRLEQCKVDDFLFYRIYFQAANFETLMKHHEINNVVGELTVAKSLDQSLKLKNRISDLDIPVKWNLMNTDEDYFDKIQLSAIDQEYKDIEKSVLTTADTIVKEIVKIERIQNKRLHQQYAVRKAAMDAANPEIQSERTLWHGTSADSLDSINRTGFNRSYCGKNAVAYGRGIYFAKNFSYSAQCIIHPPSEESVLKHVYQCKVLTGEYTLGQRRMNVPPSKPGTTSSTYDSTVDNVANPTVFVIYCNSQAYPEYLIYFK